MGCARFSKNTRFWKSWGAVIFLEELCKSWGAFVVFEKVTKLPWKYSKNRKIFAPSARLGERLFFQKFENLKFLGCAHFSEKILRNGWGAPFERGAVIPNCRPRRTETRSVGNWPIWVLWRGHSFISCVYYAHGFIWIDFETSQTYNVTQQCFHWGSEPGWARIGFIPWPPMFSIF